MGLAFSALSPTFSSFPFPVFLLSLQMHLGTGNILLNFLLYWCQFAAGRST